MAKRSYRRRSSRPERDDIGCVWGIFRMFYFRRDLKLLMNRHQAFAALDNQIFSAASPSRDMNVQDTQEAGERFGRKARNSAGKPLTKLPTEEVERILADLGHDVRLQMSSAKADEAGSSCSSNTDAEESGLKSLLQDFLVEVYHCHALCSRADCRSTNAVCPALEELVREKLDELGSSVAADSNSLITHRKKHSDGLAQPEEFMDALGILVSNKELFLRLLRRLDLHLLENAAAEEPSSSHHCEEPSSRKPSCKEKGKSFFFWKKTKEGDNGINDRKVSKIVILKPGPLRSDSTTQNSAASLNLEEDRRSSSGFSIKEIGRRLRLVAGQAQKERDAVSAADGLRKEALLVFTGRHVEEMPEEQAEAMACGDWSADMHTEKKNGSFSYEEAKKRLAEIIEDEQQIEIPPADRVSQSLASILSETERNSPSPTASPVKDDGADAAAEEIDIEPTSECKHLGVQDNPVEESTSVGALEASSVSSNSTASTTEEMEKGGGFTEMPEEQELPDGNDRSSVDVSGDSERRTSEQSASSESNSSSSETTAEKHEQPSPVSVLDSYISEDSDSPDFRTSASSKSREVAPKVLSFSYAETQLRALWDEKSIRPEYINTVLELSGLCAEENSDAWYLEDEMLDPFLYNMIPNPDTQAEDCKLLFDLMSEGVGNIQWRHLKFFFLQKLVHPVPSSEQIVAEISRYVESLISSSQVPRTLEQIMSRDLTDGSWMAHRPEIECIGLETGDFIVDELIEEAMFELWL